MLKWSVSSGCLGACQFSTPKREKSRQIPRFGAFAAWKRPPAKPIATVQKYTRRAAFRRRRAMDFARVSRIGGVGVANAPQNAWFGAGVATVSRIGGVGVANAPQNAWFGAGFATVSGP